MLRFSLTPWPMYRSSNSFPNSRYFLSIGESSSSPMTGRQVFSRRPLWRMRRRAGWPDPGGLPGVACADAVFHQTGEGRQDIDGRIDGLPVQRTVEYDLPFGDVPGQVGDRVGDVVRWAWSGSGSWVHGSVHALHDAGALVDGRQLAVQVSRISFTAGDLALG